MGTRLMAGQRRAAEGGPQGPRDIDRMVSENLGLVYDVAGKVGAGGTSGPEQGDLVSAGVQGLIQAAHSFDPGRGLAFSTHAVTRIRGAMIDEMRRWDQTPRLVRNKQRQIKSAAVSLRASLDREPTPEEIAVELDLSPEQLHGWYQDIDRYEDESLEAPASVPSPEGAQRTVADVVALRADDVVDDLGRKETVEILTSCIQSLPEREAKILALYYFEELRLREIAQLMGVTESRISQIRHAALNKLRAMLEEHGVER